MRKNFDTKNVVISGLFIALILSSLTLFFLYEVGLLFRVSINDKYVGTIKPRQIDNYIVSVLDDTDYVFDDKELDAEVSTYHFATNNLLDNITFKEFLESLLKGKDYHFEVIKQIDTNKTIAWLNEYNKSQVQPVSAYIDKTDKFEIVAEEQGTVIDVNAILDRLATYDYKQIVLSNYLAQPEVVSSDLEELCNDANDYATWSVEYTNGEIIKSDIDKVWIDKELGIIYDDSFIQDELEAKLNSYNEKPDTLTFTTHDMTTKEVKNGTLENKVDLEAELAYLKQAMKEKRSETDRIPLYSVKNATIDNTYVEVDVPQQHLWYYVDGELVLECAVVTGNASNHATPLGCYYITEKVNGKYLTGNGYKTWVNRWMRLTNTGIGLHDANWRGSFGGNIYLSNGSHGCVNMPSTKAAELYKLVDVGTKVIIHD